MREKRTLREEIESIRLAEKMISVWLAAGELPLSVIKERFEALGIPDKDIQKARKELRVQTKLKGGKGYWVLRKPQLNPNQVYRWWRG